VLLEQIQRTGYSRLPVYRRDLDDVVGILHVTDLARAMLSGEQNLTPGALVRETLTVPETMGADDLLAAIRRRGEREALVIDEYGGTAGLVTFESLMERIVGDAGGRVGGWRIVSLADGSADIDGLTLTTDVNERFALGIDEETYTTVGGFVLGQIGRPAKVGDVIETAGRTLRVKGLDGLRVAKVWLSPPRETRAAETPTSDGDAS
jgi:putative hemolysin